MEGPLPFLKIKPKLNRSFSPIREVKRAKTVAKYAAKRKALKECIMEAREQIVSGVPAVIRIPQGRPRGGVMGMLRG